MKTVEELAENFIQSYYYPDIVAKGPSEESDDMKNFVTNWINREIKTQMRLLAERVSQECAEKAKVRVCGKGNYFTGAVHVETAVADKDFILSIDIEQFIK